MNLTLNVQLKVKCLNDKCKGQEYQDSGRRTLEGDIIYQCRGCKSQILLKQ